MEVALEVKGSSAQRICYLIDDIHLCTRDADGEQPALELLRHALDHGHIYDRDTCTTSVLINCTFLSTMCASHGMTSSRARLIRHYACLQVCNPTQGDMQYIYETLCSSFFRAQVCLITFMWTYETSL